MVLFKLEKKNSGFSLFFSRLIEKIFRSIRYGQIENSDDQSRDVRDHRTLDDLYRGGQAANRGYLTQTGNFFRTIVSKAFNEWGRIEQK